MLTNESPFAIKEAYVKLRTSLLFCMTADKERPCSTFAITSAKPSEGKSLTAANIAISYAMLGKRVLLVDADMRKPTQRRLWKVRSTAGLCDFLAKISRLELVKVTDLPLWIVCTGTIPAQPVRAALVRADETLRGGECQDLRLCDHRHAANQHGGGCADHFHLCGRCGARDEIRCDRPRTSSATPRTPCCAQAGTCAAWCSTT